MNKPKPQESMHRSCTIWVNKEAPQAQASGEYNACGWLSKRAGIYLTQRVFSHGQYFQNYFCTRTRVWRTLILTSRRHEFQKENCVQWDWSAFSLIEYELNMLKVFSPLYFFKSTHFKLSKKLHVDMFNDAKQRSQLGISYWHHPITEDLTWSW